MPVRSTTANSSREPTIEEGQRLGHSRTSRAVFGWRLSVLPLALGFSGDFLAPADFLVERFVIAANDGDRAIVGIFLDPVHELGGHIGGQKTVGCAAARNRTNVRSRPDESIDFGG